LLRQNDHVEGNDNNADEVVVIVVTVIVVTVIVVTVIVVTVMSWNRSSGGGVDGRMR
jgi:hypothetical protein